MRLRNLVLVVSFAASLLASPALAQVSAKPGDLVKLACAAGASANDPCKAVYYLAGDGKRRAFPNEHVYFGWYKDFAGVKTIDAAAMASYPLGPNVTYRPGKTLVKFPSEGRVYAVDAGGTLRWVTSEDVARSLYGEAWNLGVDDINEAFFTDYRFGSAIYSSETFHPDAVTAAAPSIDADAGMSYATLTVQTSRGPFAVSVVTLAKDRFAMKTLVDATTDCFDGCATQPLAAYAAAAHAAIGIHGTYFCPPDYAACAGKTGSFLSPVFDSASGQWRNQGSIVFHDGPVFAQDVDGSWEYVHRVRDYAKTPAAAIANYPSLIEGGTVVVESETNIDDKQRNEKSTRGGVGMGASSIFLVVAKNATVIDLAYVMQALGATDAMNLDGGGSAALLYGGAYEVGPGRLLPNAIVFVRK